MAEKETYVPQEGECLSSLAVSKNFDVETAWNDLPAPIKKNLTSPNHLIPGKPILLPKDEKTLAGRAASKLHSFVAPTAKVKLRVLITDMYDKPVQGEYKFGHKEVLWHYTDKKPIPGDPGIIEKEVPADTTEAELIFYPKAAAKPPAPAAPAANATAYPPLLNPNDFPEAHPAESIPVPEQIVWKLKIGFVASHTDEQGMLARLENLGFDIGQGLDKTVPVFRAWYGTEKNANLVTIPYSQLVYNKRIDVQNDLRDIHDSLTPKSKPVILTE